MKVQWYLRTGLGSLTEVRGTTEGESTVEVLRKVLAEHGDAIKGRPFAGITMHAMPAESEHSHDGANAGGAA